MSFFINLDTTDMILAMEEGNHNFTVESDGIRSFSGIDDPYHKIIFNASNRQYLGTVGIGWEPVQPLVIHELAQELIKSTHGKYNGVFSMLNSSIIGISLSIDKREYVPGDIMDLNFVMVNSFNGMHGISGHATTSRLSCICNTSNKVYNLKHTKNVANRIEVVKDMLRFYENEIKSFDKTMNAMVKNRMNDNAAVEWFKSLFPKPNSERSENILNNQVTYFVDCLHNGRGSDIIGVKGTCYGAFQALVEYVNHYRTIKVHNDREADEVRFQAVHFGSGNTLTQKGMHTITSSFLEFSEDDFLVK